MTHQQGDTNTNETQYNRIEDMLDETKALVINNIDTLINRNDTIETLVERSEDLHDSSIEFKNTATILKREMWKKRMKNILIAIGGVLLVILICILIICDGFISNKCH